MHASIQELVQRLSYDDLVLTAIETHSQIAFITGDKLALLHYQHSWLIISSEATALLIAMCS